MAVALLALDARVVITGAGGAADRPARRSSGTGLMTTVVAPDELVTSIFVPVRPRAEAYIKLGRRTRTRRRS